MIMPVPLFFCLVHGDHLSFMAINITVCQCTGLVLK